MKEGSFPPARTLVHPGVGGVWPPGAGQEAAPCPLRRPAPTCPLSPIILPCIQVCVHGSSLPRPIPPPPRSPRGRTGTQLSQADCCRVPSRRDSLLLQWRGHPCTECGGGGRRRQHHGSVWSPSRGAPLLPGVRPLGVRPAHVPSGWRVPEQVSWGRRGWDTCFQQQLVTCRVNPERSLACPGLADHSDWVSALSLMPPCLPWGLPARAVCVCLAFHLSGTRSWRGPLQPPARLFSSCHGL